jgi:hypothetical protein
MVIKMHIKYCLGLQNMQVKGLIKVAYNYGTKNLWNILIGKTTRPGKRSL